MHTCIRCLWYGLCIIRKICVNGFGLSHSKNTCEKGKIGLYHSENICKRAGVGFRLLEIGMLIIPTQKVEKKKFGISFWLKILVVLKRLGSTGCSARRWTDRA